MWRTLMAAGLGALLLSCGGGIDSYADAVDAQAEIMQEMVSVLEGVTDEASAEKAAGKIEALGTEMAEIAALIPDLPRPSREELEAIGQQQREQGREFQNKTAAQMMKLAQYPVLADAWTRAMSNMR
ncbi:MAG: hypothetical protein JSV45_14150 [Chromatiales bacterium]|nr:MAG: hypothetical protein JSV45_14150 [Chromatiales bacterium]